MVTRNYGWEEDEWMHRDRVGFAWRERHPLAEEFGYGSMEENSHQAKHYPGGAAVGGGVVLDKEAWLLRCCGGGGLWCVHDETELCFHCCTGISGQGCLGSPTNQPPLASRFLPKRKLQSFAPILRLCKGTVSRLHCLGQNNLNQYTEQPMTEDHLSMGCVYCLESGAGKSLLGWNGWGSSIPPQRFDCFDYFHHFRPTIICIKLVKMLPNGKRKDCCLELKTVPNLPSTCCPNILILQWNSWLSPSPPPPEGLFTGKARATLCRPILARLIRG